MKNKFLENGTMLVFTTLMSVLFFLITYKVFRLVDWGAPVVFGWKLLLLPMWWVLMLMVTFIFIYFLLKSILYLVKLVKNK
jgi:hypothetical protein